MRKSGVFLNIGGIKGLSEDEKSRATVRWNIFANLKDHLGRYNKKQKIVNSPYREE